MSVKTTIVASRASYFSVVSVAQCLPYYTMFNIQHLSKIKNVDRLGKPYNAGDNLSHLSGVVPSAGAR